MDASLRLYSKRPVYFVGQASFLARHTFAVYSTVIFLLQTMYTIMFIGLLPTFRDLPFFKVYYSVFGSGFNDAYTLIGPVALVTLRQGRHKWP